MEAKEFLGLRKSVNTPYGDIAYVEQGQLARWRCSCTACC